MLLAASALCFDIFVTPASAFLNEFLRTDRGFAPWQISVFTILTNTPGGIGIVVGGRLADARGRRVIGAIGLGAGVAFTVLMYLADDWTIWLWSILGAVIGAMAVPALAVYGPELFPTDSRGRANGVINVARAAGAAAGAFLAGYLADRLTGGLPHAITLLAIGPVIVVGLVLIFYPETAARELEDLNPEDAPLSRELLGLDGLDTDIIPGPYVGRDRATSRATGPTRVTGSIASRASVSADSPHHDADRRNHPRARRAKIAAFLLLPVLVLGACGSDKPTPEAAPDTTPPPTTQVAAGLQPRVGAVPAPHRVRQAARRARGLRQPWRPRAEPDLQRIRARPTPTRRSTCRLVFLVQDEPDDRQLQVDQRVAADPAQRLDRLGEARRRQGRRPRVQDRRVPERVQPQGVQGRRGDPRRTDRRSRRGPPDPSGQLLHHRAAEVGRPGLWAVGVRSVGLLREADSRSTAGRGSSDCTARTSRRRSARA